MAFANHRNAWPSQMYQYEILKPGSLQWLAKILPMHYLWPHCCPFANCKRGLLLWTFISLSPSLCSAPCCSLRTSSQLTEWAEKSQDSDSEFVCFWQWWLLSCRFRGLHIGHRVNKLPLQVCSRKYMVSSSVLHVCVLVAFPETLKMHAIHRKHVFATPSPSRLLFLIECLSTEPL